MEEPAVTTEPQPVAGVPWLRSILRVGLVVVLMGLGLFWAADRLDWPYAWWLLIDLFLGLAASILFLARVNPELLAARRRFGEGTKLWDYVILGAIVLGVTLELHIAGFSYRFGLAPMPVWIAILGLVVLNVGIVGITWAQAVNRHFEPGVRIQSDREHAVIDRGPYAFVRHPGYISGVLMLIGIALALGSPWSLLPALATIAVLALRTVLEERALSTDLPGYAEYTRRIRYRWIPRVW
jgi:protein-S-isoprenylcysteine O-methyltransferase Ste14